MRDLFTDLYYQMEWADAAIWSAVLSSNACANDSTIGGTLHHIHLVQRAFLSIWRREPIDVHAGENMSPGDLARWAREYYGIARNHIRGSSRESLDAPVQVPWTEEVSRRLGLVPAPTTLTDTVIQVYWHTAHHRAQVATRIRQLGGTPPLIDYIAWVWQGRPAAAWP